MMIAEPPTTVDSYDAAGRLLGQIGTGAVATFSYDGADNVLLKWEQGGLPMTQSF